MGIRPPICTTPFLMSGGSKTPQQSPFSTATPPRSSPASTTPTKIPRILCEHFLLDTYHVDSSRGYVQAQCKYCSSVIKGQRNVTSNFIQHMRRRHEHAYNAFSAGSKRQRLSAPPSSSSRGAAAGGSLRRPPARAAGAAGATGGAGEGLTGLALASGAWGGGATHTPVARLRAAGAGGGGGGGVEAWVKREDAQPAGRGRTAGAAGGGEGGEVLRSDPGLRAAYGTLALEILRDVPAVDLIFLPAGNAELLAGVRAVARDARPALQVVGVLLRDDEAGAGSARAENTGGGGNGGGAAAAGRQQAERQQQQEGRDPRHWTAFCERLSVTRGQLYAAMRVIYEEYQVVVEPEGALAVAGLLAYPPARRRGRRHLVAVLGRRMASLDGLRPLLDRAYYGDDRECLLVVHWNGPSSASSASSSAGAAPLALLLETLGGAELETLRFDGSWPLTVGLRCGDGARKQSLLARLRRAHFVPTDISADDLAPHVLAAAALPPLAPASAPQALLMYSVELRDRQAQTLAALLNLLDPPATHPHHHHPHHHHRYGFALRYLSYKYDPQPPRYAPAYLLAFQVHGAAVGSARAWFEECVQGARGAAWDQSEHPALMAVRDRRVAGPGLSGHFR